MIGRLIGDLVRRTRWLHAIGAAQVALLWMIPAVMPLPGAAVFASFSMVIAFGLGPIIAVYTMNRPEIYLRPVSSRDFWRAIWLYATVAVPVLLMVAKAIPVFLLAPLSRTPLAVNLAGLLRSALYDAVYCGSLLLFLALAWRVSRRDGWRRLWRGLCLAAFFGGVVWAPLFQIYAHPDPLGAAAFPASVVAIAGVATVVSLLLVPPRASRSSSPIESSAGRRRATEQSGFVASLSGFRIVAWTYAWLLAIGLLAMTAWFALFANFLPDRGPDPLSRAVPLAAFHPALFLLRRLRTMPFTPGQLTTLLISGPIISTLAMCGAFLLGEVVTGRSMVEITPPLALLTAGGGAILTALYIRLLSRHGSHGTLGAVVLFIVAGNIAERFGRLATPATVAVAGAVMLLAAVVMQYRSLTRDNRAFRPIQPLDLRRV